MKYDIWANHSFAIDWMKLESGRWGLLNLIFTALLVALPSSETELEQTTNYCKGLTTCWNSSLEIVTSLIVRRSSTPKNTLHIMTNCRIWKKFWCRGPKWVFLLFYFQITGSAGKFLYKNSIISWVESIKKRFFGLQKYCLGKPPP